MSWGARLRRGARARLPAPAGTCAACAHFCNDPFKLEAAFPGLTAMSSGSADVRAYDGLCARRGLYLGFSDGCSAFAATVAAG